MDKLETSVLELAKKEIVKKSNGRLTIADINEILKKNGFNGLFMYSNEDFERIKSEFGVTTNVTGLYDSISKTIKINRSCYSKNSRVAIHELVHAIIDNRIIKMINPEENNSGLTVLYGNSINEGLASFIEDCPDIKTTKVFRSNSYILERNLVLQLQELYNYYSKKKYDSFVELMLREPENVLSTIRLMYLEILNKMDNKKENEILSYRLALNTISAYDDLTSERSYNQGTNESKIASIKLADNVEMIHNIMISTLDKRLLKGKGQEDHESFMFLEYQNKNEILKYATFEEKAMIILLGDKPEILEKICLAIQKRRIETISANTVLDREEITDIITRSKER